MIYRNLSHGLQIVQSCLAKMAVGAIDGKNFAIPLDAIDEIRASLKSPRHLFFCAAEDARFASLPIIMSMRNTTCPMQRAIAVLTQILQRIPRIIAGLGNEPFATDVAVAQGTIQGALNELQAAQAAMKAEPVDTALSPVADAPRGLAGPATFQNLAQMYLTWAQSRQRSGRFNGEHLRNVTNDLMSFAEQCGERLFADLQQHELSTWLRAHPSWKSVATKKRVVASIIIACNWLARQGFIGGHPFSVPDELRGEPVLPRNMADVGTYVRLMWAAPRALRRALYFLRRTGCRTCEMRELRWGQLTLEGEATYARMSAHKTWGKTKKPRIIGIDRATARFLANLRRQITPNPEDYVFLSTRQTPWDRGNFNKLVKRWCLSLGIQPIQPYGIRHLYATTAIEAGFSLRQIADQMGLESVRMIERFYGSHSRQREGHVSGIASEITKKRKRNKKSNDQ
jgi:integrase